LAKRGHYRNVCPTTNRVEFGWVSFGSARSHFQHVSYTVSWLFPNYPIIPAQLLVKRSRVIKHPVHVLGARRIPGFQGLIECYRIFKNACEVRDFRNIPACKHSVEISLIFEETRHIGNFAHIPAVNFTVLKDGFVSFVTREKINRSFQIGVVREASTASTSSTLTAGAEYPPRVA